MQDLETISVYNAQADAYKELIEQLPEDESLLKFAKLFPMGSLILDLGCGPAVSSATLRSLGLQVDPIDASAEMVILANNTFNINARQATFSDIADTEVYHGVWANFSLLHAERKDFANILKSLHDTLKPGGYLHLGMKTGSGSDRDKLGRFYTYYTEPELRTYLTDAGFSSVITTKTGEYRGLDDEIKPWVTLTSQRS